MPIQHLATPFLGDGRETSKQGRGVAPSRGEACRHGENKKGCPIEGHPFLMKTNYWRLYTKKPSNIPAAMAEPITPATLGPMACINR